MEEKCTPGLKPTPDSRDLYLGMLYSTDKYKMSVYIAYNAWKFKSKKKNSIKLYSFGYVTNTKIKIVLVIDSNNVALRENEVRSVWSFSLKIAITYDYDQWLF